MFYLSRALISHHAEGETALLDSYSRDALGRVWQAVRFSWFMTTLLHRFPEAGEFDPRMQQAEIDHLAASESARRVVAENYTGLPF